MISYPGLPQASHFPQVLPPEEALTQALNTFDHQYQCYHKTHLHEVVESYQRQRYTVSKYGYRTIHFHYTTNR